MSNMKLEDLKVEVNEEISLRKPNAAKIAEYAERMQAGAVFPPVIVGQWPHSQKYGSSGIVDGIHRLGAAEVANLESLDVEFKKFPTLEEALSFMYEANMAHGLPVTEGQRNARIKLLKKIDPKLTLERLAKQFNLSKSSVDRILTGDQGEGKSGPKGGANASKAHADQKPLKPQAFYNQLGKINLTCEHTQALADAIAYAYPETEKGPKVDKEKLKVLKEARANLDGIIKELTA